MKSKSIVTSEQLPTEPAGNCRKPELRLVKKPSLALGREQLRKNNFRLSLGISALLHVFVFSLLFLSILNKKQSETIHLVTLEPSWQIADGRPSQAAQTSISQKDQPPISEEKKIVTPEKPKEDKVEVAKKIIKPEVSTNPKKEKTNVEQSSETSQQDTTSSSLNSTTTQAAVSNSEGTSSGPAGGSYDSIVMSQLIAAKRYPEKARKRGLEGEVVISFKIHRDGSVSHQQLDKSSSSEILNNAALEMISRASPFPAPPVNYLPGRSIDYKVPIKFALF